MFDSLYTLITGISPYELLAILVIGFAVGFLFLPRLVKNPLVGLWVAGAVFGLIRYITVFDDDSYRIRVIQAMILWTLMILATYVGRYVVRKAFNAPELTTVLVIDDPLYTRNPEVQAALALVEDALREIRNNEKKG